MDYRAAYIVVEELRAELQRDVLADAHRLLSLRSNERPSLQSRQIAALAACNELQDYLAAEMAQPGE